MSQFTKPHCKELFHTAFLNKRVDFWCRCCWWQKGQPPLRLLFLFNKYRQNKHNFTHKNIVS